MGRYAVIDIGTNSTKMYIGRLTHGRLTTLDDQLDVTRLGEGLVDGDELSEAAMQRTAEAVCRMVEHARGMEADKIVAVGTAALRRAGNAEDFIDIVRKRCKQKVRVISGEQEAAYAAAAVSTSLDLGDEEITVFDIGGGSTEIIRLKGERVTGVESLPIGSRLLADEFELTRPLYSERAGEMRSRIRERLGAAESAGLPSSGRLVGLGGTFSTLAAMDLGLDEYAPDKVHGLQLDRGEIEAIFGRVSMLVMAERYKLKGLMPARADVIPAGAAIVLELMDRCGAEKITVCSRGLRHGLFMSSFAGKD